MGYLATGEIFENMLQLKRLLQRCYGVRGYAPRENFKMIDAIWCVFDVLF